MDTKTDYRESNGIVLPSPQSTVTTNTTNTTVSTTSTGVQIVIDGMNGMNGMSNMSNMIRNNNNNNNNKDGDEYAEITTVDRTMKETVLQQIQREIEDQLNRLKNLTNKEFLAEMEVIKNNLLLTDDQMVSLTLMTLREVPIKHRNCNCCYIHIKQKYNNCLFTTTPFSNTTSNISYNDQESTYNPNETLNGDEDEDEYDGDSIETPTTTPPTPQSGRNNNKNGQKIYPKLDSLRSLFNNHDFYTPQTVDKQPTDIDSILESEEMEYMVLPSHIPSNSHLLLDQNNYIGEDTQTHSTHSTSNYSQYHRNNNNNNLNDVHSTKLYIDTMKNKGINENDSFCLNILYKIRGFFLFFIPFIHTFISSLIALIILLEILTESYNDNNDQCQICHKIHDIFYGPKIHSILMDGSQIEIICFYMILFLRITTILCWYILLIHTLLFHIISCCCCCEIECECDYFTNCCCCSSVAAKLSFIGRNRNDFNHYYLMNNTPNKHRQYRSNKKYSPHSNGTILLNSSISIDEHLRRKSRTITALNVLKFYLRMVMIPNIIAIILHIVIFDEENQFFLNIDTNGVDGNNWNHNEHLNLYINICVLFGFYWSLSDWFYYDRDNILVSWTDVYNVFLIDLITNWIKFIYEIFNFLSFLIVSILIFIPLTIFVLLRILFCPCFFGYNNAGCLLCNLFQTFIEFILGLIKKSYV